MKKVFLIGGAGFIGSYLAKILIDYGYEVIIYDAFISFIDPFSSNYDVFLRERFRDIKSQVKFERGDIRYQRQLSQTMKKYQPDLIVHLAATASAKDSSLYPEESSAINSDGLVNVLESLRALDKLERFLFTSSSFVYGNFQYSPADENHPSNPIDIYGTAKLAGEIMTKTYCSEFKIPFTIIRPTAVYGFGDVNRRISQIIVENALSKKPVMLHGGGATKIDFTYAEDTANGFLLALTKKEGANETFNIARGEGREVREYAEIVKIYFPELELQYEPADTSHPERGSLDISKAKSVLGFKPVFSLEEGIRRYIEDYRRIWPRLKEL